MKDLFKMSLKDTNLNGSKFIDCSELGIFE